MVSSETAKVGIVRRAKYPQPPIVIRYKDVRGPVCSYLVDPVRNRRPLVAAEEMFQQRIDDPAVSSLVKDDAEHSIDVLHSIQALSNQLGSFDFREAPRDQQKLLLAGVEVSVRADLLVFGATKAEEQIGAAVLRLTMDDADTEAARERRRQMGIYVATLARLHVDQNIQSNRTPANRLCLSIDVQHGEVFPAPNANSRRVSDLENACRMIAALWPTL